MIDFFLVCLFVCNILPDLSYLASFDPKSWSKRCHPSLSVDQEIKKKEPYNLCPFPCGTKGGLEEYFKSISLWEQDIEKEKADYHVSYVVILHI